MKMQPILDDFTGQPGHRKVLWLMTACMVCFGLWAALSRIDQQVRGEGSIVPSGQAKIIQHLEGGIVTRIFVTEGQQVEQGEALFQISDTQAESDSSELHVQELATQLQVRRLEAGIAGQDRRRFQRPAGRYPAGERRQRAPAVPVAHARFREGINVLQSQVLQKQLKVDELKNQQENLAAELKVARDQYEINEKLLGDGAISQTKYLQSKIGHAGFRHPPRVGATDDPGYRSRASGDPQAHRRIEGQAPQRHNRRPAQGAPGAEPARGTQQDAGRQDQAQDGDLAHSRHRQQAVHHHGRRRGEAGDKLAEIIPLDEKLIVEARVTTKDRGLIWDGLPAMVKISAYDYSQHGGVRGTLKEISADTLQDEHNVPYYRVRIELEKNQLGKNMPLFPGMTADVNILSGKITIWQYLMRPIWKVQDNALREAM